MPENLPVPFTPCPLPVDLHQPEPGNLAYSLTLPSLASTPAVAHELAETLLDIHDVGALMEPALLLVQELTAYACRFTTTGGEAFLSLRQQDNALRLTVFDTHPRHAQPRLLARCEELRRSTLRETPSVVKAHHGTWGIHAAEDPAIGTRTWATLVHTPRRWSLPT